MSTAILPPTIDREGAAMRRRAGRRTALLVAALLVLPFALATLLWGSGWQPSGRVNHGELLLRDDLPLRQLTPGHLQPAATARPLLDGRWALVLAVPGECGANCATQLHLARQVQVSLNKEMTRLNRGLLGPQLADEATLAALAARWPDLAIARADGAAWAQFGGEAVTAPRLFVLDPQGRLVLRYPPAPDPQGVRRDLERLLKYSWTG